jgi:hypothetical protein
LVGFAVKVISVPAQIEFPGMEEVAVAEGVILVTKFTVVEADVAEAGLAQGSLLVKTTLTWSVLERVDEVNVLPVSPETGFPFILQTYPGVLPPLTGVALKVMEVPTQIGPLEILEVTETDGVTDDTPVTVNTLDVT